MTVDTPAAVPSSVLSVDDGPMPSVSELDRRPPFPRPYRTEELEPTIRERRIAVVGLGYVGLPTALAFADRGWHVDGVDISAERRSAILDLQVDLRPGDRNMLAGALSSERLAVLADPVELARADAVVVSVPTPVDEDRVPDLRAVQSACASVVAHAQPGQLLVLMSTSYVGTTRDLLVTPLAQRGLIAGRHVNVAFCPERISPGDTTVPIEQVPRVVGGITPACTRRAAGLLRHVCSSVHPVDSPEVAEMAKLLENSFRAVNLAFINEVADVCGSLGLNVREVIDAAATKTFGFMPFLPGPGVGGHCIPCDPHYLLWQLRAADVGAPVIDGSMAAIARRPRRVVERLTELLVERGRGLAGTHVAVVGVTYKAGVTDIRQSPALEILLELRRRGARVSYVDPRVPLVQLGDGTTLHRSSLHDIGDATAVVVHTLHDGVDLCPLADAELVLDTTYRLTGVPHRILL